jgi:hypothetical protein
MAEQEDIAAMVIVGIERTFPEHKCRAHGVPVLTVDWADATARPDGTLAIVPANAAGDVYLDVHYEGSPYRVTVERLPAEVS